METLFSILKTHACDLYLSLEPVKHYVFIKNIVTVYVCMKVFIILYIINYTNIHIHIRIHALIYTKIKYNIHEYVYII